LLPRRQFGISFVKSSVGFILHCAGL
jgi:hypothetical protein